MNVPSSSPDRLGLAWASCYSSRRAGPMLGLTVIVASFSESVVGDHSKITRWPSLHLQRHAHREPYTTLLDVT